MSQFTNECKFCGKPETEDNILLPFGTRRNGHSWVHDLCWQRWFDSTRALDELTKLGQEINPDEY